MRVDNAIWLSFVTSLAAYLFCRETGDHLSCPKPTFHGRNEMDGREEKVSEKDVISLVNLVPRLVALCNYWSRPQEIAPAHRPLTHTLWSLFCRIFFHFLLPLFVDSFGAPVKPQEEKLLFCGRRFPEYFDLVIGPLSLIRLLVI